MPHLKTPQIDNAAQLSGSSCGIFCSIKYL
jgi:hypothetical protein